MGFDSTAVDRAWMRLQAAHYIGDQEQYARLVPEICHDTGKKSLADGFNLE